MVKQWFVFIGVILLTACSSVSNELRTTEDLLVNLGESQQLIEFYKENIKDVHEYKVKLPFLIDLMNVCVQTGMTIEACLEYLAFELRTVDHHLAYVVKKTVERSKLVGLEKALNGFYDLVPTSEALSFVMTMTQSLKYGSSIGSVLTTLASDIREMNMMDLVGKIGKMGAKMSIPLIVFIMVPIIILIAALGIMRMFSHG